MIITARGHFWLEFENGYTISVFNDWGSYSENHDNDELRASFLKEENQRIMSETCEVGIMHDGELLHIKEWGRQCKRICYTQ